MHRFTEYFGDTSRLDTGNRIAERFRREYALRRGNGQSPPQIFFGLLNMVGQGLDCEPKRQAAIIGLIAYLFHTCEIFEPVPAEVAT